MRIVGHARVISQLEEYLPEVTLLIGPESVGKMTVCAWAADHHGAHGTDVLRLDSLRMSDARGVRNFLQTRPMGDLKAVLLRLDVASVDVLNVLLKEMEEPPQHARFLLTSVRPPLLTIMSRSLVHRMGLLSEDEVEEILRLRGMAHDRSRWAAQRSGGRVRTAMEATEGDAAKSPVRTLLKAIVDSDEDLLSNALRQFEEPQLALLRRWVLEARSGRWVIFEPAEGFGLQQDRSVLERMDRQLRSFARPKIMAKMIALPLMAARRG